MRLQLKDYGCRYCIFIQFCCNFLANVNEEYWPAGQSSPKFVLVILIVMKFGTDMFGKQKFVTERSATPDCMTSHCVLREGKHSGNELVFSCSDHVCSLPQKMQDLLQREHINVAVIIWPSGGPLSLVVTRWTINGSWVQFQPPGTMH